MDYQWIFHDLRLVTQQSSVPWWDPLLGAASSVIGYVDGMRHDMPGRPRPIRGETNVHARKTLIDTPMHGKSCLYGMNGCREICLVPSFQRRSEPISTYSIPETETEVMTTEA